MIKLIDILKELNIQRKSKLGKGSSYTAYPSVIHPDKVIKVSNNYKSKNAFEEHYYLFSKYPDYFPIVYKKTDKYMVLEKLDTKEVKDYNKKILALAKKKLVIDNPELPESLRAAFIKKPHFQKGNTLSMHIEYYLDLLDIEKTEYTDLNDMDDIIWLVKQDSQLARITKQLHELEENVHQILQKEGIEGNGEGGRPDTAGRNNIGMDNWGNFKFLDF